LNKSWFEDSLNWFCTSLRNNKNTLAHYLDNLRGCGTSLEDKARGYFFNVLNTFVRSLKKATTESEIKLILSSLKWKLTGRDHASLSKLQVFTALHETPKLK